MHPIQSKHRKNLPLLQQKYPKLKMYNGGLPGGEAYFTINTVERANAQQPKDERMNRV